MDRRIMIGGLLAILMLAGCNDQKVIEDLAIISMMSFDQTDEPAGDLKITASFPNLTSETSNEEQIIETIANSKKEAEDLLSSKTRQQVVNGQIHSVILGEQFARHGVKSVINSMERDQEIGSQVKVVVADQEGSEIIRTEVVPDIGSYIDKMLKTESDKFTIPETDIYHFSRDYYDDGIDPVAPLFSKQDGRIVLVGTALFRNDRYVDHLDLIQSKILMLLLKKVERSELTIKMAQEEEIRNVHFDYVTSHRKVNVYKKAGKIDHITIRVKMRGSVLEDTGKEGISSTKEIRRLESLVGRHIQGKAEEIIEILKENQTDSLGLGQYIRQSLSYEEWTALDKERLIETVPVSVEIDVTIKDTGMSQ
ncbi:Ger(x)C family spore germination protein [Bacillus hwajinpoensis]|uniref:Ger(X)C family spore germination protein n=1 Tax=Guptibacillus hwajinpoensis TaxID=208199 RepID=A0A845F1H8_9BACL|nr:Ger(x)C family spore germination protein [Pseudalkalibacillus hwajinpoensis]MYL64649.1 Ger(x)C family spore germination protein [Pseudalkalibacillus hwajinpoensis]